MTTCVHFYILEPQGKPMSLGVCKYCGESKLFSNLEENRKNAHGRVPPRQVGRHRKEAK